MFSRKNQIIQKVNLLSEKRYIDKKFLMEENDDTSIKLQVTSVAGPASINKYKISYLKKQPNGNLKDVLTDEILKELGFNIIYTSNESAQLDINKKSQSEIHQKLKDL